MVFNRPSRVQWIELGEASAGWWTKARSHGPSKWPAPKVRRAPLNKKERKKKNISTHGVAFFFFGRSHKRSLAGAQILPAREASQAIKIFESNLGNDQPQTNLMDDGEKKIVKVLQ